MQYEDWYDHEALRIRTKYALYKVLTGEKNPGFFDGGFAGFMGPGYHAVMDAEAMGQTDFRNGRNEPPILFDGEEVLIRAWQDGWDFQDELAEMAVCDSCNDDTGNPCHAHG